HLFKNLAANYQRLPSAFYASRLEGEFNNIPAIICGAGPSLKEAMPYLKFSAQKALIIAGGSTITALSSEGIETHLNFAIDPNPEEYSRLHQAQAFETPLCYGNRLQADVWNTCNGPMGYLHTCTGGASEIWMEKELGLESEDIGGEWSDEAMSVTTLAIATAAKFGCNPIILVGLDLAYTNMQSYSSGVLEKNQVFLEELKKDMRASEKLALRKDRKGKLTHTLIKWIMESSAISKFAKAHKEIEFINATSGGIGFEGIEYTPIEKVFCTLTKNFDLQGLMHERILGSKIKLPSNLVSLAFEKLRLSAIKCEEVILSAVEELIRIKDTKSNIANGKMLLFEMELFEEIAYKTLLHGPSHALDFALSRRYRTNLFEDEYNKTLAKWNHLLASTRNYLSTINTLPDRVKK
ncbi:MAG: DUF115 domain-containing protein, partial [Simkaniaceae bacterium]|nr:DUF115 domain-containing protein [Simkaniaceae bacterium]